MIDGYKCRDGKVVVVNYDDENNVTEEEREYQDNIEELLKAENMEEHLDDLKDKYEDEIRDFESCIRHYNIKISDAKFMIIMLTIFSVFLCLFKPWIPLIVGFFGSVIYYNLKTIIPSKKKIKETKKEISAAELILEGIEEQVQKNQKDLRRLRNDVRRDKEDIRSEYRQFDLYELNQMDKYLELWGYVGKNEEDLLWYEQEGKIYSKLKESFEQEEIRTLRRILTRNNKRY